MDPKQQDEFYKQAGANIHVDPSRFSAIANLCRGKVLDIGCGTGDLADYYDGDYTGLDQSTVAIEMAKSTERTNANFFTADAFEYLENIDTRWNTIVMAEFLEHIKDWESFVEILTAKIKSEARLVISVPNGDRIPDADHINIFTVPQLRKHFSTFGYVRFHTWEGFKGRIIMTVDLGRKNPFKLALGMVCKNEGKGIETAVLSCLEVCDEVVIMVDDKSTDDTLKVAQRYADTVKTFTWPDDFSKARNLLQDNIYSEWMIVLDGHEFVKELSNIRERLDFKGDGFINKVRLEEGFTFDSPRIIRREVKWEHKVHNNAKCKKVEQFFEFQIQHDRLHLQAEEYIKERADQRFGMIKEAMYTEMKKDKTKGRPYFYLGELYFNAGKYKKATKLWKKYLKYGIHKGERWLVTYNIAMAYNYRMKFNFGIYWLEKADKEFPGRWEIEKALGLTYLCLFKYQEAADHFVLSLEQTKGHFIFSPMEFDLVDTWDKIGICFRRTDRLPEALVAWKRAIKLSDKEELTDNLKQRVKILEEVISAFDFAK